MDILPAIDLRSGKCVRLIQGDYQREIRYRDDPVQVALDFQKEGARWIHIVDLDGAKQGKLANLPAIKSITQATSVQIEVGGGIRCLEDIRALLDTGITRVILGTKALLDWPWFENLLQKPELANRLALGLDARDGRLAVSGWTDQTAQSALDLAQRVRDWPLAAIIYTDISKDGMLVGPNLQATEQLALATTVPVIAAGGVTTEADVRALAQLPLAGIIIGRALYEGRISLSQALRIAGETGKKTKRRKDC
ncbi:MAG: 1-(5-phosphoribosyl)-5-[(5-phosphoribosylamino)methylideneamino]imidazole-4-carboxamide isomerase [Phycisphaerae bacterium]|nr:1-(5-phosphoribosyl)-5-[(5-phosphoribosylamino)methylideneamino]imidazole-4-carboxamide isomerase [Phycisphaerae bacterium]